MSLRIAFLLVVATACQGPALSWPELRSEDPEPSADPELRVYKEAHYRALGTRLGPAGARADLLAEVDGAELVYLGDHHVDRALHAEHLALLEELHRSGRALTLGLEAIGIEDEPAVRRYLDGEIPLEDLCATVRRRWPDSWLDSPEVDAAHYRDLLAFAKRTGTTVFALEPTPRLPLPQRDRRIAARVAAARHPGRLTVVVVGHTHLLGAARVVERVGGTAVVVGARLSRSLRDAVATAGADGGYRRSDAGVWFPPQAR